MNAIFQNPRRFAGSVAVALVAMFGFLVSPAFAQDEPGDNSSDRSSEMKDQEQDGKPGKLKGRNRRGGPGQFQKNGKGGPGENKDGMPGRPAPGKGKPGEGMMQMFARMDKDSNGTIDKSEAPERLLDRFEQIDTSGNGQIDRDEMQAMVERMAERMKQGKKNGKPGDSPLPGGKRKRGGDPNGNDGPPKGSVDPVRPGSGGNPGGDSRDG